MAFAISSRGNSVLDVGCGTGTYLVPLAEARRECFGVDPLKWASLSRARESMVESDIDVFLCQSVGKFLPFKNELFDVALCISTLQHVSDHFQIMNEIKRVLKNGGLLLACVPTNKNIHSLFRETKIPNHMGRGFNVGSFEELLVKCGFRILEVHGTGFFPPFLTRSFAVCYYLFGEGLSREIMRTTDVFAGL